MLALTNKTSKSKIKLRYVIRIFSRRENSRISSLDIINLIINFIINKRVKVLLLRILDNSDFSITIYNINILNINSYI